MEDPGKLEAEGLFALVCRHATADGKLDEAERTALKTLQKFLRIAPERAKELLEEAKGGEKKGGSLEPEAAFKEACALAWRDGDLERYELELLVGLAGAMGIGAERARTLLDEVCRGSRPVKPAVEEWPLERLKALTPAAFAALKASDRIAAVAAQLRAMNAGAIEVPALIALVGRAEEEGKVEPFLETWVALLMGSDPRIRTETHDTKTIYEPGGQPRTETENHRVDDSWAKEQLLYLLRDRVKPASPLVDGIAAAFASEANPVTRMRIVRALGKIGGAAARRHLEAIARREKPRMSHAWQEADRWLTGKGHNAFGTTFFSGPPEGVEPGTDPSGPAGEPRGAGGVPGKSRSPQGWTDAAPGWPKGSLRGAVQFPSPGDAVAALAEAFERAMEALAGPDTPASGAAMGAAMHDYATALQALYILDTEMAHRKGTYGWLVAVLEKQLARFPDLVKSSFLAGRLRYLVEDLGDSGDADLAREAKRLGEALTRCGA